MGEESASNPFSVFDQLTAARAAMEEEEEVRIEAGVDPSRVRRDAQRRAKTDGPLRARPRSRSRPHLARIVRGHMENPGADN